MYLFLKLCRIILCVYIFMIIYKVYKYIFIDNNKTVFIIYVSIYDVINYIVLAL